MATRYRKLLGKIHVPIPDAEAAPPSPLPDEEGYSELAARLPLPTDSQCQMFARHLSFAVWHLPPGPPRATFYAYLDPAAGTDADPCADRPAPEHREDFGYWTFWCDRTGDLSIDSVRRAVYDARRSRWVRIPAQLLRATMCSLTWDPSRSVAGEHDNVRDRLMRTALAHSKLLAGRALLEQLRETAVAPRLEQPIAAALYAQLLEATDDRETRRVYADALVDMGDPMGHVMALAHEGDTLDRLDTRRWELEAEAAIELAGMPALPVRARGISLDVVGGLIRRARGSAGHLGAAALLLSNHPLRELVVTSVDETAELEKSPLLGRIERLELGEPAHQVQALLEAPRWSRLSHLSLRLDQDQAQRFAEQPVIDRLQSLRVIPGAHEALRPLLETKDFRPVELRHLAEAPLSRWVLDRSITPLRLLPLPKLRSLSVNRLADASVVTELASLERLRCERPVNEAFFASALPASLRALEVSTDAKGVLGLSAQRHLRLHHFELTMPSPRVRDYGGKEIAQLLGSGILDECASLSVVGFCCEAVLAELPRSVRSLHLHGGMLGASTVGALRTRWPAADRLVCLSLDGGVDLDVVEQLFTPGAFPSLRYLSIERCDAEAIKVLAGARLPITHLGVGMLQRGAAEALIEAVFPGLRVVEASGVESNPSVETLRGRYAVFAPDAFDAAEPSKAGTFDWRGPAIYAPFEWSLMATA